MNQKYLPFIFVALLVVFLGVFLLFNNKSPSVSNSNTNSTSSFIPKPSNSPSPTVNEEPALNNNGSVAQIIDYSPEVLKKELENENTRVLLFFSANWCPSCKLAEKDIRENITKIPGDLVIIKADYDTEKELKSKYGVTYQDTFI